MAGVPPLWPDLALPDRGSVKAKVRHGATVSDEQQQAEDVYAAMKFGTKNCLICRVNYPAWGRIRVDGVMVGYCRPCVVGWMRIQGIATLDDAETAIRWLIRDDKVEADSDVKTLRTAQEKIRARQQRDD